MRAAPLLLIALLATPLSALADNPYAVAGISNPALVPQFVVRLQRAVAADNRAAVAAMINYPITVRPERGAPRTYPNAAALRANYATVFTPEVKAAIATAKPNGLFVRDLGVMIGNGEIWMNEVNGSIQIISINPS